MIHMSNKILKTRGPKKEDHMVNGISTREEEIFSSQVNIHQVLYVEEESEFSGREICSVCSRH